VIRNDDRYRYHSQSPADRRRKDERAIREVCREVAQTLGFHTSIADSAEHAYRVLESNLIDVVLLDLKLPGEECLATGDLHCAKTDDPRPMTEH